MEDISKFSKLYFKNPLKHLELNYNNVESPVSYLGPQKIYDFYNGRLSLKKIKKLFTKFRRLYIIKTRKKIKYSHPHIIILSR